MDDDTGGGNLWRPSALICLARVYLAIREQIVIVAMTMRATATKLTTANDDGDDGDDYDDSGDDSFTRLCSHVLK